MIGRVVYFTCCPAASPVDLMLRNYDPELPLPQPDLVETTPAEPRRDGPRPYVHVQPDEHGGYSV